MAIGEMDPLARRVARRFLGAAETPPLSEAESLGKLNAGCAGSTGDNACCAIVGLRAAGWVVTKEETPTEIIVRYRKPVTTSGG